MHAFHFDPNSHALPARGCRTFAVLALWLGAVWSAAAAHVLMVVGNTTLNGGDTAVYNRLVNQGHAVTLVSGAASTTNDAAGKNLVMISSTITSSDVNTKFRDISTAAMVWESALLDDMGMTGATAADQGTAAAQTQLAVTAGTPLSAALSGLTTVTSSGQTYTWGVPNAATAIQAATLVGAPAGRSGLFAYPKGAAMVAGTAAGARVGLFLNDTTASTLGADGWTLFDTAVSWALAQAPVATESLHAGTEPSGPSSRRTGLVFSEIMYNPAFRADLRDTEFIEIQNNEPFSRDIGGFSLDGAVSYTFPSPTVLAAGARVVVARTPADLQTVHGITGVLGPYTGSLDNGGGELRLLHRLGAVLLELEYDDDAPWPKAPDGGGPSLTLARPSFGEADPAAWSPSAMNGGTPGAAETWPSSPWQGLVVNEILANSTLPAQDFVELYNHSPADINLGGVLLADNPTSNRYVIAANTILSPGEKIYFSEFQLGFSFDPTGEAVFVFSPAGDRVIDAVGFGPTENGVPLGRYPDGAPEFRELQLPTPGLDNQPLKHRPVVINEIMYHPLSQNRDDEYIELHNTGDTAVSLAGWELSGAVGFVFPAGSSIAPGGYLVVTRNRARFLTRYPAVAPAAVLGDYSGSLADSGDRIRLRRPQNPAFPGLNLMDMDEVEYRDGGSWGVWADGGGSSLELTDPLSDNRRAANWADSDETAKAGWTAFSTTGVIDNTASGTPGTPNELHVLNLEAGECLVDKISVRRDTDSAGSNRVPNGDFETNLTGWILQGNHDTSTRHTAGGAGGSAASLRLTAAGDGDNGVNRAEIDLSTALASGQTATISGQARWLRGSTNLLLRLKGNGLEAVAGLVVPANLGTPGAVNTRRVTNAGPSIREVRHFPVLPAALEEVTVSARVEDADEVTLVNLRYRVDPSATVSTVAMSDMGTGGDAVAGDGIWTARIPGQTSGAVVAFSLEALDYAPAAASRIFPPDAPVNECLIRWGDVPVTNVFTPYRLWTTAANQALWISRQKLSNALIPGSFVYGNFRVVHGAGMRYRGSPFIRPSYDSPVSGRLANLVFRVPEDEDVMGATAFNLDAMEQDFRDGSLQREMMSFWLAEQMGAPFIHQRFATLVINGIKRGEVYQDSQQPNGDYLDCWFPGESDGELYEIDDWFEFNDSNPVGREFNTDATLSRFTTTGGVKKRARYRWSWQRKGLDATGDSPAGIFGLVETMNAADDATFLASVKQNIDITSWWRDFTVRRVFGDWDGYGYNRGKNTFLYRPAGGKWKLLLWDMDFSAGAGSRATDNGLFSEIQDPVLTRFYNLDPLERVYWGMLKAAANGPMSATGYNARSDEIHSVFLANGLNAASPATAQTWVAGRRTYILGQLAAVNASFAITTNGGNNFSSATSPVTISGTSPVDAATLTLNGQPIDVTWTSVTAWTATVFPQPGANTLVFSARDALGNPLPALSDTIVVTYTGGGAPAVGNIAITEVMYNPPDQVPHDGADIEFIELKNTGSQSVNLGGATFTAGITYTFPAGTTLAPGTFLLLASSSTVFNAVYPWRTAAGDYDGQLANGGETLTLVDGAGNVISSFTFDDVAPWPAAADGAGYSLVPVNPNPAGSMNNGALWRASSWFGGSPGADDPEPVAAAPVITQQPATLIVDAGQTARFICLATGYPQPAFQWRRNGVDIPGANGPVHTTAATTVTDSGTRYDCRVSNAHGAATSESALLVVRSQLPLTRSESCQLVYYPFREGSGTTVNDVSGFGTPLNLSFSGSGVSWLPARNGVNVTSSSVIASAVAAAKVHTAIQTSRAMTVELWAKPLNTTQAGPARMFGVSADTNNRNFGMMQNAANLDFRVRTSVVGNNGTPATTASGVMRTSPTHFVATFTEAGGVKIYTNGVQAATGNPGGNIANWNSSYRLLLANEPSGNRPWLGEIYLAAVHSCELTPAQIQQNLAAGSNPNPFATLPPAITSTPADQTIACVTLLPPPATNSVAVTWNCSSTGTVVAADTDLSGGGCPGNARLIRRVFTAIDRCGFMSTSTQTFSVVDNVAPVVTCPAPPAINAGSACTAPAGDYRALATVSDGCSAGPFTVTQSPAPGTQLAAGTHTITLSSTDACGNTGSCTFPLTVRDVTPPVVICATIPYTRTVGATCTATVPKVAPFISDNCTAALSVVVTQVPVNGAIIGPGTHTIVVTATDAAGNSSQCSATLIVSDLTAPVITCPPAVTLPAGPSCQAAVPALNPVSVTDNCGSGAVVVTQSPAAGTLVGPGLTTVTLTARDAAGNQTSCTVGVTVTDSTPPSISCPATFTLAADTSCQVLLPALSPVAADNCTASGSLVITQSPAAGTALAPGAHTVTLTARDAAGNQNVCTVVITVSDQTAPVVACPGPLILNANAACQAVLPTLAPALSDNCTATGAIVLTQTPPGGTVLSPGSTNVVFTATDTAGNRTTCTVAVTVRDATAPSLACPGALTLDANASCQAAVPALVPASLTDNCGAGAVVLTQSPTAGTLLGPGAHAVTLTATDAAGNATNCTVSLTIRDVTPPALVCPAAPTLAADGACEATLPALTPASLSDNCGAGAVVLTQSPAAGTRLSPGTIPVTLAATDAAGNRSTCIVQVVVRDTTPPVLTCPPAFTVNAGPACQAAIPEISPEVLTDNCGTGTLLFVQSPAPGTLRGPGVHAVTLSATDAAGNVTSCSVNVTVRDVTPPVLTCPGPLTLDANASCQASVPAFAPATLADNCGAGPVVVTQSPAGGTPVGPGAHTITLTATDAAGNAASCTVTLTVRDVTAPVLVCPPAVTVNANGSCQEAIPELTPVTLSDNCGTGSLLFAQSPAAGTLRGPGAHIVTLTATDAAGNATSCTVTVTVRDVTAPVISCPAPLTLDANATCQASLPALAPAALSDNCGAGAVVVTQSPASGTLLGLGAHTVTLTATDAAGNTQQCTVNVTVRDVTAPAITCPAPITLDADGSCHATLPAFAPAALSDNCGTGSVVLTQSPAAGTMLNPGVHTVTLTATDAAGNAANCQVAVTVRDATAPVLVCPPAVTLDANASCQAAIPELAPVTLTDNCGTGTLLFAQSPAAGTLRGPGAHIVTLTATDAAGNATSCTVTVTVRDVTAPVLSCPAPLTLDANATCQASLPALAPAALSDNCGAGAVVVSQSPAAGTLLGPGVHAVTLTATDAAGNVGSCAVIVTVRDVTAPAITCPAALTLDTNAACLASLPALVPAALADNCGPGAVVVIQSPAAGTLLPPGLHTVTLTATDAAGNAANCAVAVTVRDVTAPVITCPAPLLLDAGATCQAAAPALTPVTLDDNCGTGAVVVTQSPAAGTLLGVGAHTVTLTATDAAGNAASCTVTVTVRDVNAPVIACPAPLTLDASATCQASLPALAPASLSDNCGAASVIVTQSPSAGTLLAPGLHSVTLTATDAAGNVGSCSVSVTVRDVTAPAITCPAPLVLDANAACQVTLPALAAESLADNCGAGAVVVVQSPAAGTLLPPGQHTVTLTATDAAGNAANCAVAVTVRDLTAPVITCPAPLLLDAGATCQAAAPALTPVTLDDNCGTGAIAVTQAPAAGTRLAIGEHSVTLTATDAAGNAASCTVTVTVRDVTAPVISCPAPLTLDANATCQASLPALVAATLSDNCGAASVILTQTPAAGTLLAPGVHAVTLTATDAAGNVSSCAVNVTVRDATAPVIACPASVEIDPEVACSAHVPAFTPSALNDNCDAGGSVVTQTPAAGTLVGPGAHTVTLTATDAAGNTSFCTLVLTVRDGSAPTFTCPSDILLDAEADCAAALPALPVADLADNCDTGSVVVVQIPAAGTRLPAGAHTVRLRATDLAGNQTECLITATVRDVTPPSVNCPNPLQVEAGPACQVALPALSAFVSDACTASNALVVVQTPSAGTPLATGTHQITVSASDAAGNTSNCVVNVIVIDASAPVPVCPPALTLDATGCTAPAPALAQSATDNCTGSAQLFWTQTPAPGTPLPTGSTTITLRVADEAGNLAECTVPVLVRDAAPPTLVCPADLALDADSDCLAVLPALVPATLTDDCGGNVTLTQLPTAGTALSLGTNLITLTATDAAGNAATCTVSVIVRDVTAPVVSCPPALQLEAGTDCQVALPAFAAFVADACTASNGLVVVQSPAAGTLLTTGAHVITVSATDAAGNTSNCVVNVTVIDATAPALVCPGPLTLDITTCTVPMPDLVPTILADARDNCTATNQLFATQVPAAGTPLSPGDHSLQVRVTDAAGNLAECTVAVTVRDIAPVALVCPPDATVAFGEDTTPAATGTAVATNACGEAVAVGFADVIEPGSCAQSWDIRRTWSALDGSGQTNLCAQVIRVRDTTAPVITAPVDQTVACAGDIPAATAADDHDPAPSLQFLDENLGGTGCAASPGQIRRTWTAVDACGNTTAVARVFTVIDNLRPVVVSSPLDRIVQCLGDLPAPEAPVFVDNCDSSLVVTLQRIDQFSSVNCARTVLYNWAATDDCGNRTRVTQRIIVRDTTRPVILTCPAGGTVTSFDQVPAASPDTLVAADNCDSSLTVTSSTQLVDLPGCQARVDHTYTVADDCGNFRLCVQSWTVDLPGGAPSVWIQPRDQLAAAGQTATFSVAAAGCSALTFQWWRDGSALPGATGTQFTTAPLTDLDTGSQFWCVATSAEGVTTTRRALLTLPSVARSLAPIPLDITEAPATGEMDISLPSEAGVVYRLQKSDSLQPADWINCGPGTWGNGTLLVIPDPADSPRRRYYRVVGYPQLPATP